MKSHRRSLRRLRTIVAVALCVPLSASASALAVPASEASTQQSAPQIGDTPADFAQPVAPAPKAGDTPADYPGAKRAPGYEAPATITVNRPERTIVRDVNDAFPTILASLALLVALGGTGFAVIRTRSRHGVVGRSH